MAAFLDACRFTPTAGGTTDFTFSAAVVGYNTPALAGVVNGRVYKWRAESADLSQWELFEGAFNTGTGVAARTAVLYNSSGTGTATGQSGAGTKITFSTVPQVACVGIKEDLISIEEANAFTTAQKTQAKTNIGAAGSVVLRQFTASGTYTPTTGMLYCIAKVQAAGGGGGGTTGLVNACVVGGSGGGGECTETRLTAAQIGGSQTVTIGAVGTAGAAAGAGGTAADSSLGVLATAKGGKGGQAESTGAYPGTSAAVASGGTGDVSYPGQGGNAPLASAGSSGSVFHVSIGGSSNLGNGGVTQNPGGGATQAGAAGNNYGGGGGGGISQSVASNIGGGAGGPGIILIYEFCVG